MCCNLVLLYEQGLVEKLSLNIKIIEVVCEAFHHILELLLFPYQLPTWGPLICFYAYHGNAEMVSLLLQLGVQIDNTTSQGTSTLSMSATNGKIGMSQTARREQC